MIWDSPVETRALRLAAYKRTKPRGKVLGFLLGMPHIGMSARGAKLPSGCLQ